MEKYHAKQKYQKYCELTNRDILKHKWSGCFTSHCRLNEFQISIDSNSEMLPCYWFSVYFASLFTDDSMVVLVLKGEIELLTIPDMRYAYTINTGDIFC